MNKLIGNLVCWWRKHHIDGYKKRVPKDSPHFVPFHYCYECSRCGRIREAADPVKRVKKS